MAVVVIEEADIRKFFRRLLYKLSGLKVVSFLLSGTAVMSLVVMAKLFHSTVSDEVVLKAMDVIKDMALGMFVVKGAQNIVGMLKGQQNGGNGNGNGQ